MLSVNDLLHALGKRENGEAVHQGDKTLKAGCLQVFRHGRNVPIFRQFFHQTNTVIDVEDDKFNALGVYKLAGQFPAVTRPGVTDAWNVLLYPRGRQEVVEGDIAPDLHGIEGMDGITMHLFIFV